MVCSSLGECRKKKLESKVWELQYNCHKRKEKERRVKWSEKMMMEKRGENLNFKLMTFCL